METQCIIDVEKPSLHLQAVKATVFRKHDVSTISLLYSRGLAPRRQHVRFEGYLVISSRYGKGAHISEQEAMELVLPLYNTLKHLLLHTTIPFRAVFISLHVGDTRLPSQFSKFSTWRR